MSESQSLQSSNTDGRPQKRQKTYDPQEIQVLEEKAAKWDELLAQKSFAELEELQTSVFKFTQEVDKHFRDLKDCIASRIRCLRGPDNLNELAEIRIVQDRVKSRMRDVLQDIAMIKKPSYLSYLTEIQRQAHVTIISILDTTRLSILSASCDGVNFKNFSEHQNLPALKARNEGNLRFLDLNRMREKCMRSFQGMITGVEKALQDTEHSFQELRSNYERPMADEMEITNRNEYKKMWEKPTWTSQDIDAILKHGERMSGHGLHKHIVLARFEIEPVEKTLQEMKNRKLVADESIKNMEK